MNISYASVPAAQVSAIRKSTMLKLKAESASSSTTVRRSRRFFSIQQQNTTFSISATNRRLFVGDALRRVLYHSLPLKTEATPLLPSNNTSCIRLDQGFRRFSALNVRDIFKVFFSILR